MPFFVLASAHDHATGIALVTKTSTTIRISWTDRSEREDGFRIQYRATAGGPNDWTTAGTVARDVTLYTITGLTASTEYEVRVSPYNRLFQSTNMADTLTTTTNAAAAAGTDDDQWTHPLGKIKGKWRVREVRVKDDLIVENGNSTADL